MVDAGVAGECRTRFLTEARHNVEGPRRQTRLQREPCDQQRGERRFFGRLQHAAVPGGERRGDRAAHHLGRVVPRDDVARNAVRFVKRVDKQPGSERDGVAVDGFDRPRVKVEVPGGDRDIAARLGDRLAGVEALDASDLFVVAADQ